MTLRQYLFFMSIATLLCWLTWIFILISTDPYLINYLIFSFFYLSLFLSLLGTFSIIALLVRTIFLKDQQVIFRHVKRTFRKSATLSFFLILFLILLQKNLLTWWNSIMLATLFFVFEGMIFSNRHYRNRDYV